MANEKVLALLGFASKARKLEFGMQKSSECIKNDKSHLIVYACDLSEKSRKEILFFAHNKKVDCLKLLEVTIEELSTAVGRKGGIISVNDKGFANAISKILGGYANDQ